MADAKWLRAVTAARWRVAEALSLPVTVTVLTADGAADPQTGQPKRKSTEVLAVVRGADAHRSGSEGEQEAAQWRLDLLDSMYLRVRPGDIVRWGGDDHRVRRVTGLTRTADGDLYGVRLLTD